MDVLCFDQLLGPLFGTYMSCVDIRGLSSNADEAGTASLALQVLLLSILNFVLLFGTGPKGYYTGFV
jgi:hypothetical protein